MPEICPFNLPTAPSIVQDKIIDIPAMPSLNFKVDSVQYDSLALLEEISSGGEGIIYKTTIPSLVCKIYHKNKLTNSRKNKIKLMITRKIQTDGICWPIDIVTYKGIFVGYLMPFAQGKPIQITMFTKQALLRNFPLWNRGDLVDIAISFTKKMSILHSYNIIVGDINPLNILVDKNKNLYFVDTDSYQVENFPCPVGTINFTAPEIQGKDYGKFLRTKDHELFAVSTMIFMILFPGKPPYSQQGGGTPGENIRNKNFSYRCDGESEGTPPAGSWSFIWSNLTKKLRVAFCETFKQGTRKALGEWKTLLEQYRWAIDNRHMTDELFPLTYKIFDPINVICEKCGTNETASEAWVKNLQSQGKGFICGECLKKIKLQMLTRTSLQEQKKTEEISSYRRSSMNTAYKQPTRPTYSTNSYCNAQRQATTLRQTTTQINTNTNTRSKKTSIVDRLKSKIVSIITNILLFPFRVIWFAIFVLWEITKSLFKIIFDISITLFVLYLVLLILKSIFSHP